MLKHCSQNKPKRRRLPGKGKVCISLSVLLCVFALAVSNAGIVISGISGVISGKITFEEFTEQVQKGYASDQFRQKDFFINVNGLFARMTHRSVYNDAILLKNGMLARTSFSLTDPSSHADALAGFAQQAQECCGTPLLYVQLPGKPGLSADLLPEGVEHDENTVAGRMVDSLQERGIDVLDLREELTGTGEAISLYFYKTDHHWNYTGAFLGYQRILEKLQTMLPERNLDTSTATLDAWEAHTIPRWFLGSIGKRVGIWYAGVDDFTYYTPKFDTDMSMAIPKHSIVRKGSFEESVVRGESYLEKETSYFDTTQYCLYIGGDYPLVHHRNAQAPNAKKILLVRDSFSVPLQAYLSTMFQEVDVIDLRYYDEGSLLDYVKSTKPDLVMYVMTASSVYNSLNFADLCESHMGSNQLSDSLFASDLYLQASESSYNYQNVLFDFQPGATYQLRIDNVQVVEGDTVGLGIRLFDFAANKVITADCFDLEYSNEHGGIVWSFTLPESGIEKVQLLLYAGLPGQTAGNSLLYMGVQLFRVE